MLDRFRVSNFKSLMNVEIRPAGLNLLVGPNNAGKTNLCHALRFLSLTTRMSLDEAAKECTAEPWNLLNVYAGEAPLELGLDCSLRMDGEPLNFSYELKVLCEKRADSKFVGKPFNVCSERLTVTGGKFSDTVLLQNNAGQISLFREEKHRTIAELGRGALESTTAPTNATILFRLYELKTYRTANLFKQYLSSWGYFNLEPDQLRSNVATSMDRALQADGSNLCSVLYALHNERPREEKKLVEAAKLVEPRLDLISFQSPDPEHVYMFFEDNQGHRFGVQNVSGGTLRFLALCFLIIANRQESTILPAPPLMMIEEPENGIFVGHLKALFEKIDPSGSQGQFFFTSHNPYFIDLFDGALEGLHVIKSEPTHSAVVRPDPSKVRERLGKFSLGEMHFRGLLE